MPMAGGMLEGQADAMAEITKQQSIGRLGVPRKWLLPSCPPGVLEPHWRVELRSVDRAVSKR